MRNPSYDSSSMTVDEHAFAYHSGLFRRDQSQAEDLLWLTYGSGYVDLHTATAHELEHSTSWEYEFSTPNGSLKKKDGFYRLFFHNGVNMYETVVVIPAYYIDDE